MERWKIKELVGSLTIEEKASLTSGADNWFTKSIERLHIPAVRTSDGPHGLRTQSGDTNSMSESDSIPAVCFPSACTMAASFDRELIEQMGEALGRECQALGVHVLLGPGVNIKRSPLCGRNFEYFSEDPLVSGELGAALVNGIQKQGVGACVKHFFANSQEHQRMNSSSELDERTMREIYLSAFETIVKKAKPWTMMASYNKIGGVYSTANKLYLTNLLRNEWGYEGLVMSDWGATHDRPAAVTAGCALTMPSETRKDSEIVDAVNNGVLSKDDLDRACEQMITLAFRGAKNRQMGVPFDYEGDHVLARKLAEQSAVLLKNKDDILPLRKEQSVAFIGRFAEAPRYQGGGSSHINSFKVVSAREAAETAGYTVAYAQGYPEEGVTPDDKLIAEAAETARQTDIAVIFAGLPEAAEAEGVDRRHMDMPASHNVLIKAVCEANPNTVVVLYGGSPAEMPWVSNPKAILMGYLGGQAIGEAIVNLLYGKVNPSGHLAETFPKKLEDNPSYLFYFGEGDKVHYNEGCFVGYRYYTSKKQEPLFPFGHGLSYTNFAYSGLALDKEEMADTDTVNAFVTVKNIGDVTGGAVVQLYIAPPRKEVIRPVRELKGFEKVWLAPDESKTITFALSKRAFAHWAEELHDWRVEDGKYAVQICENAHQVILEHNITIRATQTLRPVFYSMDMTMGELAKTPIGHKWLDENISYMIFGMAAAGFVPKEAASAMESIGNGKVNLETVEQLAHQIGMTAAGNSGLSVLFSQPVSLLAGFVPTEKTAELKEIMDKLNRERA